MSISELKLNLVKKINASENEALLKTVDEIFASETDISKYYKKINDDIKISMKQIENGNYSTNEEVSKRSKEWIKKHM